MAPRVYGEVPSLRGRRGGQRNRRGGRRLPLGAGRGGNGRDERSDPPAGALGRPRRGICGREELSAPCKPAPPDESPLVDRFAAQHRPYPLVIRGLDRHYGALRDRDPVFPLFVLFQFF